MKFLDLFFQSSSTPALAENLNIINEATEANGQSFQVSPKKMTLLKEAVSWGSALVSLFSLSLTGEKFPIYKDSKANVFLDKTIGGFKTDNKIANASKKIVHSFFKELFSIGGVAINAGLFLLNGSSLPLFKDSFIGGSATKIANATKTWWNEKAKQDSILGKICKGLSSVHETKNHFITSKFTYNTLAFALTIACLGAGPVGWGIGAGVLAADVALGAVRVKRIHDLEDELSYLILLKSSRATLKQGTRSALKEKDELNQAVIKASKTSLIHQVVPVFSIATSVINPVNIGVTAAQGLLSAVAITTNRLTEEEARQLMESQIASLRNELGAGDMSKEELGKGALKYATQEDKNNPIFSDSKLNPGIGGAIINGFKYIGNYIHPLKKPTSYVKSWEKLKPQIDSISVSAKNVQSSSGLVITPSRSPSRSRSSSISSTITV
jgi:hypothetical protein